MNDVAVAPSVKSDEWLARFILYSRYIRENHTIRPEAFMPHPMRDLSVTRRLQLSNSELWDVGRDIALTLYGRADVRTFIFQKQKLRVVAAPEPNNPNHANVTGWPEEKSAQKSRAQEIAASAGTVKEAPTKPI
jgi:hypothetical protein